MLCGIDEVGRGCLAGPLVITGLILKKDIEGLADSKKLSSKKREELYKKLIKNSYYHTVFTSAKKIDEKGLSICLKNSILEIMEKLKKYTNNFLMDGNTSFGISSLTHKIKADESVPCVSAASIIAKVSRDKYMQNLALKYPKYKFEKHKGYGTKEHISLIKEHGRCIEHRYTFKVKNLNEKDDFLPTSLF